MRSFLRILTEVLSDIEHIPELQRLEQVGIPSDAQTVPNLPPTLTQEFGLKFARLQTLLAQTEEVLDMPAPAAIDEIAGLTGGDPTETFLTSQCLFQDGQQRIMMLNRLIVELVRELVPTEQGRNQVSYYMKPTGPHSATLVYAPIPRMQ